MASEIRVNTINNSSGLGTITISDTGAVFTGVTTITSLEVTGSLVGVANTDIINTQSVNVSGVVTATSFSGDGSALTGLSSDAISEGNTSAEVVDTGSDGHFKVITEGTEALRVDSSQRVGIGTSVPSDYYLSELVTYGGDGHGITIASSSTSADGRIYFADGTTGDARYRGEIAYSHSTDSLTFNTAATQRAKIDSSGRLLAGTTSSTSSARAILQGNNADAASSSVLKLAYGTSTPVDGTDLGYLQFSDSGHVNAAHIAAWRDGGTWTSGSSQPTRLQFSTTADGASSPTERMRIGKNGFIKASNYGGYWSTANNEHEFTTNYSNTLIARFYNAGSNGQQYGIEITTDNDQNDSTRHFFQCVGASTIRAVINSNGGFKNYQSNDVNLCDEREKKNIVNLDSTWDCLKNWELKKFHYNEDADTDDKRYGVIAQQVAEYCPEVIADWTKQEAKDAVLDDDGNVVTPAQEEIVRMGVKEQQMMWMAIKALQEAQTRIETLETEKADILARLDAAGI